MWKFILVVIILYVGYRFIKNDATRRMRKEYEEKHKKVQSGEMVQDPICKTYIIKDSGYTIKEGDTIHHFCSTECREIFLQKM